MPPSTVLLTGATGLIGFHILLSLLKERYIVKAVVRSSEKSKWLLKYAKIRGPYKKGQLTFATIPDFSTSGAWDEPLQGVQYLVHAAFQLPYPESNPANDVYWPNIKMTDNLFKAVLDAPTLKRIIITSSIHATMPRIDIRGTGPYSVTTAQLPTPQGPFFSNDDAYQVAKIHQFNESHSLVKENSTRFDVINILPGHVLGIDARATTSASLSASSNATLVGVITGMMLPEKTAMFAHLDDVVEAHIKALDPSIKGNQDFAVCVPGKYNDIITLAKRNIPKGFESGTLTEGNHPSEILTWDSTPTEAVLGMKFQDLEAQVMDTGCQFLKLLALERPRILRKPFLPGFDGL